MEARGDGDEGSGEGGELENVGIEHGCSAGEVTAMPRSRDLHHPFHRTRHTTQPTLIQYTHPQLLLISELLSL
jgi:hypothetical protein